VPLDAKQAAQLKRFGANVSRERMRRGFTQERLSESVDLNPRTIQKIEGGSLNILLTTFLRIQRGLRCSWENLLGRH
jgi:transcriptional regulator with XRE-family HTH domain